MNSHIHLQIARQRHREALAQAERLRIANACDPTGPTLTLWRRLRDRASAVWPPSKPEITRHPDVETGWEA